MRRPWRKTTRPPSGAAFFMAHPAFAYLEIGQRPAAGDAVPGPLGFPALGQKHDEQSRSAFQENRHHLPSVLPPGVCCAASLAVGRGRRYIPYAAAEDRALLGSNPSAATVQGHGRRCLCGSSPSPMPCFWRKATNPRGLGTASPKAMEVRENRMSHDSQLPLCVFRFWGFQQELQTDTIEPQRTYARILCPDPSLRSG